MERNLGWSICSKSQSFWRGAATYHNLVGSTVIIFDKGKETILLSSEKCTDWAGGGCLGRSRLLLLPWITADDSTACSTCSKTVRGCFTFSSSGKKLLPFARTLNEFTVDLLFDNLIRVSNALWFFPPRLMIFVTHLIQPGLSVWPLNFELPIGLWWGHQWVTNLRRCPPHLLESVGSK